MSEVSKRIWFDLDNSPHVPLFRPIIAELQGRGEEVLITSRRHAQTEDLLKLWNIPHISIGTHGGKSKVSKIINLMERTHHLRREIRTKPVTLAVSHGSRTQLLAAASMGIRTLVMDDYEYSDQTLTRFLGSSMLVPQTIPEVRLKQAGIRMDRLMRYDGFKEEIYLSGFTATPEFRASLGVQENTILITMRPPSISANYHDPKSEFLFRECLEYFCSSEKVLCLIVNRTEAELRLIPDHLINSGSVRLLENAVDGLQLLWSSDIMVSGGGTMNREAALLGIPTYSVFSGLRPAMDEKLEQEGKLKFLGSRRDIEAIPIVARDRAMQYNPTHNRLASKIADIILEFNARSR